MNKFLLTLLFIQAIYISYSQQPEIVLKTGSKSISLNVSFSPTGKYLISAEEDNTVRLWDIENKKLLKEFSGHTETVTFAAFLNGDKTLISASLDGTVRIWDSETGKELKQYISDNKGLTCAALSGNKSFLVAATVNKKIIMWDLTSGWKYEAFGPQDYYEYTKLEFTPDNNKIIAATSENYIYMFDPFTGTIIYATKAHEDLITGIAISPDGNKIYSSSEDSLIKVWNTNNGKYIKSLNKSTYPFSSIKYLSESNDLLCGRADNSLCIIDAENGTIKSELLGHNHSIVSIDISPDSKNAATSSFDRTIKIWDLKTSKEITTFSGSKVLISSVYSYNKGKNLVSAFFDGSITIWDLEFCTCIGNFKIHDGPITSVSVSRDNKYILTSGYDEKIKLFDINKEQVIRVFSNHTNIVSSAVFTPDDKQVISGSYDKTIKIWDVESGNEKLTLRGHTGLIKIVAISKDGTRIVSGGTDSLVIIWKLNSSQPLNILHGHKNTVNSVCFSSDGNKIYSGGIDRSLFIWDLEKNNEFQKIKWGQYYISSISISDNGDFLACGSYDASVYLWKPFTQSSNSYNLTGHQNTISCVSFSSDNKYLASGSWDGTIKLWDINSDGLISKKLIATIVPLENSEYVILSPDNYYTSSKNGYKSISFKLSNYEYPFEQFDLIYNRPDILFSNIGYTTKEIIQNYKSAYFYRLKSSGINEQTLKFNTNLPFLKILNKKELSPINVTGAISLQISAEDFKSRLNKLKILVNGIPIYGKEGMDLSGLWTYTYTSYIYNSTLKIPLTEGNNKILVSVLNLDGLESIKEYIEVFYKPANKSNNLNLYAIVIGISSYKDTILNLHYASKDASDFTGFINSHKSNFGNAVVYPYFDQDATKSNILKVKELLKNTNVNDVVMIYISGQGLHDQDLNYYFATYDVNYKKPHEKGISMQELEGLFDGIPARKRILLLNTSNSGEVNPEEIEIMKRYKNKPCFSAAEMGFDGFSQFCVIGGASELQKNSFIGYNKTLELVKNSFVDLSNTSGAIIIASSSSLYEYIINENNYYNGVFTYSIMEGLNTMNADENKNGVISITELKNYMINSVKIKTNNFMRPVVKKEVLDYDYDLWR